VIPATQPQGVEWLFRLLAFIGGAVSTVLGSWVSSKIRVYHDNRKAHHNELREKILTHLLSTLEKEYKPLVGFAHPLLKAEWKGTGVKEGVRSTEEQWKYGLVLEIENPWPAFKVVTDPALYQDAKVRHFRQLLTKVESFAASWEGLAENMRKWIQEMSQRIGRTSGLQQDNRLGNEPYADHDFLGMFAYMRIYHLPVGVLRKSSAGSPLWSLTSGPITVAMASSPQQLDAVIQAVDDVIAEQQTKGEFFMKQARELNAKLGFLTGDVRLAIASKKLRKSCDLVSFI
jgi:hypothetical protein